MTGDVVLSGHAVSRYRRRLRPGLNHAQARRELYGRLRSEGEFAPTRPRRLIAVPSVGGPTTGNLGYVIIDEDVALPIRIDRAPAIGGHPPPQPFVAETCLVRTIL
jgi:hypothetical protein